MYAKGFMFRSRWYGVYELIFILIIVASLMARVFVVFFYQVNWDEFYFLSLVYEYERGELSRALQTFHVHLFLWITELPLSEVKQIVIGRLVMLGCNIATVFLVYRIGSKFFGKEAALFGLAAYSTLSFVQYTAASFRADPVVCLVLVFAAYGMCFFRPGFLNAVYVAVAIALAVVLSVKAIFLIPTMALLGFAALMTSECDRKLYCTWVLLIGFLAVVFFGVFLAVHMAGISDGALETAKKFQSFSYSINRKSFFPRADRIKAVFITDFYYLLLMVFGIIVFGVALIFKKYDRILLAMLMFACLLPLSTLIFYRNAYPYFFAFILPFASIVIGGAWYFAVDMPRLRGAAVVFLTVVVGLLAVASFAPLVVLFSYLLPALIGLIFVCVVQIKLCKDISLSGLFCAVLLFGSSANIYAYGVNRINSGVASYQSDLISVVKQIFPEPVPYIDGVGMIASYPRVGFFMSTWGLKVYRNAQRPIFRQLVERFQPRFVIANTSTNVLNDALNYKEGLLQEDAEVLSEGYVNYWGHLYIAGKNIYLKPGVTSSSVIYVAGYYNVVTAHPVTINGQSLLVGERVWIDSGSVSFSSDYEGYHKILFDANSAGDLPGKPLGSLFAGF